MRDQDKPASISVSAAALRSTRTLARMAQWHLDELRAALERRGWRVTIDLPGNDYDISATWRLVRSGQQPIEVFLEFDGLDDLNTLPVTESYACSVRGTRQSLYFRRRGDNDPPARERWMIELAEFAASVGTVNPG